MTELRPKAFPTREFLRRATWVAGDVQRVRARALARAPLALLVASAGAAERRASECDGVSQRASYGSAICSTRIVRLRNKPGIPSFFAPASDFYVHLLPRAPI